MHYSKEIRYLINKLFKTDADLNAFLIDCFPDIQYRISGNMDRVDKVNLLLQVKDQEEIIKSLLSKDQAASVGRIVRMLLVRRYAYRVLVAVILLLIASAVSISMKFDLRKKVSANTIHFIIAYAKVTGKHGGCDTEPCKITYYVTGGMQSPAGIPAKYEDTVQSNGPILKEEIQGFPKPTFRDEEFHKDEPNKLTLIIESGDGSSELQANIKVPLFRKISPSGGTVSFHLPYITEFITFYVDLTDMGFEPKESPKAFIVLSNRQGKYEFVTSNLDLQVHKVTDTKKIYSISTKNLPAGASLLLKW